MQKFVRLVLCITLPLFIGGVSGIATADAIPGWYQTLNKPFFNPPNWLFGPVWTTLYILMGVSLFQISSLPKSELRTKAIQIFILQLTLNFFWSFLFFYFHQPEIALLEIIGLWVCIAVMIHLFKKLKPVAGYLNIPYLLWVSFASILNGAYAWLN
jgi:translocator protein